MATFLKSLVLFAVIMIVLTGPLVYLARQRRLSTTIRNFVVSAGLVVLVCALMAFSSERLVEQCEAEKGSRCVDAGSVGMQVVIVTIYGIVALIRTYNLRKS